MAVFTEVSPRDIALLLAQYNIGEYISHKGIEEGIENTNYYVSTDRGSYVLTIFERLKADELNFYLKLCKHLADKGLPVSNPQLTRVGTLSSVIQGKPCAIAECIPGETIEDPSPELCSELGTLLAKMHLATKDFNLSNPNTKGIPFWIDTLPKLKDKLPPDVYQLLEDEVNHHKDLLAQKIYQNLEIGACHADLFRNNALVKVSGAHQAIGGIIDFYFACTVPYLYDLAVTVNDWCIDQKTGEFIPEKASALMNSYNKVRPLSAREKEQWQNCLRGAACRFWISRLYDYYLPREAALLSPHDPAQFEKILRLRREANPDTLPWV